MLGRIGSTQMVANFTHDLGQNQVRLSQIQHQYATGKKVDSPADDPVGVGVALGVRSDLASVQGWRANVHESQEWLSATDSALQSQVDVIHHARELAVQAASGTLSSNGRQQLAAAIDQLLDQSSVVGNSTLGGRYLFGGTAVNTAPFDAAGLVVPANAGLMTRAIGQGVTMSVNITADRFQQPAGGGPDIFTTLSQIANAMRTDDTGFLGTTALTDLDKHLDNQLSLLGEVGAKVNRLELAGARFDNDDIARRSMLSSVEDADMAQVTMDLMTRETVLKASLAVGSRIIQPSLADFLR